MARRVTDPLSVVISDSVIALHIARTRRRNGSVHNGLSRQGSRPQEEQHFAHDWLIHGFTTFEGSKQQGWVALGMQGTNFASAQAVYPDLFHPQFPSQFETVT
jgi:hypothetical protein